MTSYYILDLEYATKATKNYFVQINKMIIYASFPTTYVYVLFILFLFTLGLNYI